MGVLKGVCWIVVTLHTSQLTYCNLLSFLVVFSSHQYLSVSFFSTSHPSLALSIVLGVFVGDMPCLVDRLEPLFRCLMQVALARRLPMVCFHAHLVENPQCLLSNLLMGSLSQIGKQLFFYYHSRYASLTQTLVSAWTMAAP